MAVTPTPMLTRLLSGAACLLGLALLSFTRADPDLWGHVRYGLDMLENWSLPAIDPYSFTQDVPWVNHEWLSELMMGAFWRAGGTPALALLKGALVLAALMAAWRALDGVEIGPRAGVLLILLLGTARLTTTLRPQVWTLLCLALLCRGLMSNNRRWRWWLPGLFVVWVNAHGGWIVGLGVLGLWCAVEWWTRPGIRRQLLLLVVATMTATLVNPYGWGMWDFIGSTVRMGRDITEWQPLWTVHPLLWLSWLAGVGLGVLLLRQTGERAWPALAVLAMLAYASLRVERLAPLFVLTAVILAAAALRRVWPAALDRPLASHRAVGLVLVATCLVASAAVSRQTLTCLPVEGEWAPDFGMARRLDGAVSPARLVVFFDWGQYALWHWGPGLKVSMDGRRETIYSERRLAEHASMLEGRGEGLDLIEAWRAEYIWLPKRYGLTESALTDRGYRIEVSTESAVLAARADLPALPTPLENDKAVRRCFPR